MDPKQQFAELKKFFNALADRPIAPGQSGYVAGIHDAADAPTERLKTQIDYSDSAAVYYFTGQRGTGKSSELLRLKQILEAEGNFVIYADMAEHLSHTEPVELGDFMISVMGALSEGVEQVVRADPARETYWERVAKLLVTEVKVDKLDLGVKGANIKLSLKDDPTFKRRLQTQTAGYNVKIVQQARAFSTDVVELLRHEKQNAALKVVFIVDSLERIRADDSKRAEDIYRSVVNLFASHVDNLQLPLLHVVYTVPPYLTALSGGMGGYLGGSIYSLPSIHVFEKNSRDKCDAGVAILEQLVQARYANWREVFQPEDLRRLAVSSGGDIRDFFRLLKMCLVRAGAPNTPLPVETAIVEQAEHRARNDMQPIAHNDLDWLKRISNSHQCELADITSLSILARFFDSNYVLNYRNGSDWYDVHPLLRDLVDAHVPAAASANT